MSAGERVALFSGGGNRSNTNASKALVEFRAGIVIVFISPPKLGNFLMSLVAQKNAIVSRKRQIQFNGKEKKSGHITSPNLFSS